MMRSENRIRSPISRSIFSHHVCWFEQQDLNACLARTNVLERLTRWRNGKQIRRQNLTFHRRHGWTRFLSVSFAIFPRLEETSIEALKKCSDTSCLLRRVAPWKIMLQMLFFWLLSPDTDILWIQMTHDYISLPHITMWRYYFVSTLNKTGGMVG